MKTSLDPSSSTSTFSFSVAAFGLLPSPHAFCETTLHTSFHLWNLHLKPILPNESFVPWVVQKLEVGRNWGQWRPPPHVNLLLPGLSNVAHYWLHQSWRTFTWLPFLIPLFQSCRFFWTHFFRVSKIKHTFFGVCRLVSMSFSVLSSVGQEGKLSSDNLANMNSTCTSVFLHFEFENSNSKRLWNSSSTSPCFMLSEFQTLKPVNLSNYTSSKVT